MKPEAWDQGVIVVGLWWGSTPWTSDGGLFLMFSFLFVWGSGKRKFCVFPLIFKIFSRFVCIYICQCACACRCPQQQGEGIRLFGCLVTGSCEPLTGNWILVLWKSKNCSQLLSYFFSLMPFFKNKATITFMKVPVSWPHLRSLKGHISIHNHITLKVRASGEFCMTFAGT